MYHNTNNLCFQLCRVMKILDGETKHILLMNTEMENCVRSLHRLESPYISPHLLNMSSGLNYPVAPWHWAPIASSGPRML
jgi:hypothetical protein